MSSDEKQRAVAIENEYSKAAMAFFKTLHDRLLLAADVQRFRIEERWKAASAEYERDLDADWLDKAVATLRDDILSLEQVKPPTATIFRR